MAVGRLPSFTIMQTPSHHQFVSVQDLIDHFGGRLDGDGSVKIYRFASLAKAHLGDASFLASPKYQHQLKDCKASLLILKEAGAARQLSLNCAVIETDDPYLYFARAAGWMMERARRAALIKTEIHPSAVVHPTAVIGERVRIGPMAVIGARVQIDDDCDIGPGCVLEEGVRIGASSLFHARVVIYASCRIGDRAIVHSGAVIGADGFGFAPDQGSWLKIPQVGAVVIGNDVEIGANTTIDRGTLDDTVIGNGVKLDNQIQIAHNVVIGEHTAMAGCVGVAGSAVIGSHCQIGGSAGILGHLTIADGTIIGPMSLVTASIETAGKYVGVFPLQPQSEWEKSAAIVKKLTELRRDIHSIKNQKS